MFPATVINILLLASAIVSVIIAGIIYVTGKRSIANILLSLSLVFASLWGISIFSTIVTGSLIIGNLSFSAAAMIPPFLILFILSFQDRLDCRKTWWILVPAIIIALLSNLPNSVSLAIRTDRGFIEMVTPGSLLWLFDAYFAVYVLILFYSLIKAKNNVSGIKKIQLRYLIFGLGSSVIFGSLFNLVFPLFGIYQFNNLGPVFILFMSSSMAYAATKHYLTESQVVFSEIWAFLLVFLVLVWLLMHSSLFNIILFILVLGVCIMFIRSVLSEAKKNYELEKQKKQLINDKEELKTLDKLKDDFLKMATHELNTPVTVIQGKMSMIFDENLGNFSAEHKNFLGPVFQNSTRLIKMIKEILDTLKIDQNEAELSIIETDLAEVVTKIIQKAEKQAKEKNIEIIFNSPKQEIPKLMIDSLKIQDVFVNLLNNAIKFSHQNGKIIVSMSVVDGYLKVSVSDNGVGISLDDQKHIFEKFFQAKRFDTDAPLEQQGSGLGLYISKKFIELHKGKLVFESAEGKGSKFAFYLPLAK